jgi:hypothetical protein
MLLAILMSMLHQVLLVFQNAGTWYDYFSGATFNATGTAQEYKPSNRENIMYM